VDAQRDSDSFRLCFSSDPLTSGHAAFEAKIFDGGTHALLAELAEKRFGGSAEVDGGALLKSFVVGSFTKYDHAQVAFSRWSRY